ncbi:MULTISPECIES: transposase [Pseudomonas]|uniref:transposase n=1 Tax=Pseudomonas TaxID=286 RepID=UPI0035315532
MRCGASFARFCGLCPSVHHTALSRAKRWICRSCRRLRSRCIRRNASQPSAAPTENAFQPINLHFV